ncbi:transposase [Vibrio caribbeanicus]|uniref:transposase n=1 Tax=Vibrio caribbeanicus TaxID=701175 RepID=UPI002284E437|nr:transposase [Vibrio caribbeanicus]MCY9844852.1 transposase [Vibrio caribbeanicus]
MTTARKQLISIEATSYYHCVSRCVRRSFLCGEDKQNEVSYEHRREWIIDKIHALSHLYCIDICAYAIMSNHYHLVVNINQKKALDLSNRQVVVRWAMAHKLPLIVQRWLTGQITSQIEYEKCNEIIEVWRKRLWDLSWYMKELNYDIACRANKEDDCTGHFWEGRFKSQALLDEKALAAAMAYVDLNPIRAGIADKPENSDFTSIQARIDALDKQLATAPCLHPFVGNENNLKLEGIPFRLMDYLELVDWTARQIRPNKASMDESLPPILDRLGGNINNWLTVCTQLEKFHTTAVGSRTQAIIAKAALNKKKLHLYAYE